MAAAYVNGLQSRGVAATIKHFVANDQESERTAANSVISDRALREVYLYPYGLSLFNCGSRLFPISFMLAQKDAKPWAYMTSYVEEMYPLSLLAHGQFRGRYGRLWGTHCSENPKLLEDILRGEWGHEGIIMSDWYLPSLHTFPSSFISNVGMAFMGLTSRSMPVSTLRCQVRPAGERNSLFNIAFPRKN